MDKFKEYKRINNSFKDDCLLFHVGVGAGFFSEICIMMWTIIYCYKNKIKFMLYSDDANFNNNGWNDFFEPFCEENHNIINKYINSRSISKKKKVFEIFGRKLLKKQGISLLTQDVFNVVSSGEYVKCETIEWKMFNMNGTIFDEFAKLDEIALHFNKKTRLQIEKRIKTINLPSDYVSVQIRGGDKIKENRNLNNIETVLYRMDSYNVKNVFVFSDDYSYIEEIKKRRPSWTIYTLTKEDEKGYNNKKFNKKNWEDKKSELIKLFAMVEICIKSRIHFGNEISCANNYIRSKREMRGYVPVWTEKDAQYK